MLFLLSNHAFDAQPVYLPISCSRAPTLSAGAAATVQGQPGQLAVSAQRNGLPFHGSAAMQQQRLIASHSTFAALWRRHLVAQKLAF